MSEVADRERRGPWSRLHVASVMFGQLVALGVLTLLQALLPEAALEAWGWRIPFAIGGLIAVLVFWIRTGVEESAAFTALQREGARQGTTASLLAEHPR